jgi:hypothetical protein
VRAPPIRSIAFLPVEFQRLAAEDLEAFDWARIEGGTSRLVEALAHAGMESRIARGRIVEEVWWDGAGLGGGVAGKPAVRCRGGVVSADRRVLALPLEPFVVRRFARLRRPHSCAVSTASSPAIK